MNPLALVFQPVLLFLALANPPGGGQGDRPEGPPPPPPQALEACADKQSGDTCSFSGREGEAIAGTCFTPASDKPLACRPDNPPPRH